MLHLHLDLISVSTWIVIGGASLTVFYLVSLWGLRFCNRRPGRTGTVDLP